MSCFSYKMHFTKYKVNIYELVFSSVKQLQHSVQEQHNFRTMPKTTVYFFSSWSWYWHEISAAPLNWSCPGASWRWLVRPWRPSRLREVKLTMISRTWRQLLLVEVFHKRYTIFLEPSRHSPHWCPPPRIHELRTGHAYARISSIKCCWRCRWLESA